MWEQPPVLGSQAIIISSSVDRQTVTWRPHGPVGWMELCFNQPVVCCSPSLPYYSHLPPLPVLFVYKNESCAAAVAVCYLCHWTSFIGWYITGACYTETNIFPQFFHQSLGCVLYKCAYYIRIFTLMSSNLVLLYLPYLHVTSPVVTVVSSQFSALSTSWKTIIGSGWLQYWLIAISPAHEVYLRQGFCNSISHLRWNSHLTWPLPTGSGLPGELGQKILSVPTV